MVLKWISGFLNLGYFSTVNINNDKHLYITDIYLIIVYWSLLMIHRIEVCSWFSVVKKDQRNSLTFQPSLMSFCTQGLPGVAESTTALCEEKPSPWEEGALHGGWGVEESALPRPSTTICDGPPSPGGRGLFYGWWILRLRHSAPRRMTGWGHAVNSESSLTRETNQKGVWRYVHWFLIDAMCIG